MPAQLNFLDKRLATNLAGKWLKANVLLAMRYEIRRLAKTLSALGTPMGLFPGMYERVLLHVGLLVKPLATELAGERPYARVNELVGRERRGTLERFRTVFTSKRLG